MQSEVWYFGDPRVQAEIEVVSEEVQGDTVITKYRHGRITMMGVCSRPSQRACQEFAETLDEITANIRARKQMAEL